MSETKLREILPGIFIVHLPLPMKPTIVNVTLLRTDDGFVLVDTGVNTSESVAALEDALRQVGCAPQQLRAIVATHHHPDHYGASRVLKERSGATVYLHPREMESSRHYARGPHSDEALAFFRRNGIPLHRFTRVPSAGEFWARLYGPVEADRGIADGEVLRFGSLAMQVIATPGHTSGHCVLYLPQERVMIVGDHLLPKITPHVGFFPGGPPNPLADFIASQRKVQEFDVAVVLPAHGGSYVDHRHRANQIIQHHHYRLREMLDLVRSRPRTAWEVASAAWGFDVDGPLQVQFPATFEALAHLEYLRCEGRVVAEELAEQICYRAA